MKRRKHIKKNNGIKIEYFRDFGDLSDDSVVTDFYRKRNTKKQLKNAVAKGSKLVTRTMTDEEKEKYNVK